MNLNINQSKKYLVVWCVFVASHIISVIPFKRKFSYVDNILVHKIKQNIFSYYTKLTTAIKKILLNFTDFLDYYWYETTLFLTFDLCF